VILLGDINIMLDSFMISVNSPEYTCSSTNMRFSKNFVTSRIMLSMFLTEKYYLSNSIGEENIKNSIPSSNKLTSLIMCLTHMLINKMGRWKDNIDTLLRLVCPFLPMLVCP
jgi:hypothetical protein